MSRRVRVLHVPTSVGGQAPALAAAERAVGLDSRCVTFYPSPFGYPVDEVLFPGAGPLVREWRRWKLLARAIRWADVIHFNFGASIMPRRTDHPVRTLADRGFAAYAALLELRDPSWLHRMGKGIVVTFQGDDLRQGDRLMPGQARFASEVGPDYYRDDARKRSRVARLVRSADAIYALNPDLLHLLPPGARFLPYCRGRPPGVDAAARRTDGVLRVAHAPTHRGVKGTRFVVEAVDGLRADGRAVELDLVEGVSHAEVLRRVAACDVFVDQLLVGWYGAVGLEAMMVERPVVCFIDEDALAAAPKELAAALPILRATPRSVGVVLRTLMSEGIPEAAGAAARRYAERWHDPVAIAEETASTYRRILRDRTSGRRG